MSLNEICRGGKVHAHLRPGELEDQTFSGGGKWLNAGKKKERNRAPRKATRSAEGIAGADQK